MSHMPFLHETLRFWQEAPLSIQRANFYLCFRVCSFLYELRGRTGGIQWGVTQKICFVRGRVTHIIILPLRALSHL